MMEFKNNVPIYVQIIEDIENKIISGQLKQGQKLPSSREIAVLYQVNPNTASRVYSEMERMGFLYIKRGIGTFLSDDPDLINSIKAIQTDELTKDFMDKMTNLGYTKAQIIEFIKNMN